MSNQKPLIIDKYFFNSNYLINFNIKQLKLNKLEIHRSNL